MAKKAAAKEVVSLDELREESDESQRRFLNLFWKHYLDFEEWPTTFEIHRKYSPDEIANCLGSLGADIVREQGNSQGNRYELSLIGILLTNDGEAYEEWLVNLLEFLRGKYLQEKRDDETFEYDEVEIGRALKLNEKQQKLLGQITQFETDYRSYGHTVGGNWKIRLPEREIQHVPRTGSLKRHHEKMLFRYFNRKSPVMEKDRQALHFATAGRSNGPTVSSFLTQSESIFETDDLKPTKEIKNQKKLSSKSAKIFVSHSSQDKELAQALTDLLRTAFRLRAEEILCTSVPGHKLAGGADTEEELLAKLRDARLLIGVLTPASLSSSYVLFELGARWGLQKPHIPLVASGAKTSDIKEPLKSKNALNAADQDDVLQLVEDVAKCLGKRNERPSALNTKVRQLVAAAKINKLESSVSKNIRSPRVSDLRWPKLIDQMTLKTSGKKNGCASFHRLAEEHGLKPHTDHSGVFTTQITCAGVTLTERNNSHSIDILLDDTKNPQKENNYRDYEFQISPNLLEKTSVIIDKWFETVGIDTNSDFVGLSVQFYRGVTIENETHKITANIFETELNLIDKNTFELGKYSFDLYATKDSWIPVFEMVTWSELRSIPWQEIFTSLVKRQILIIEKPLAKEIWS